jgi:uncharacterized protein YbbC (DUF1343 family)
MMSVLPGISVLLDERRELIAGRRIGMLTHAAGVLPDLSSNLEVARSVAEVRALFAPEHGLRGAVDEAASVGDDAERSGTPIYSLYGANLAPTPEQLAGLDCVVCDIQDVGCRFYTYAWTLLKLMSAAAGVAVIVADRPNPVGGVAIEGPGVEPELRSLVGLHDVPIRHGLTIGELARLVNMEARLGCELTVVPCAGWRRDMRWPATGLPWVPTSPNMPAAETALVYPGTCLLEGTNVSVGRGTAKPFEWLGAPWIDGAALAAELNRIDLPGVRWRPVVFQPWAAPYVAEPCEGVQPHVLDPEAFRPVVAGVTLLVVLQRMYPEQFAISASGGIYADQEQMARRMYPAQGLGATAHFDRLAGSTRLRSMIQSGASAAEIAAEWSAYLEQFRARVGPALLYGPLG